MELVRPDIGLIFWMVLSFGIVLFILGKFAWKPIMASLKERENSIEDALLSAERAKEEMVRLKSDNEKIMIEARRERDLLLKEAKDIKDQIIVEAKKQAVIEADKLIENAKKTIESEKKAAMNEMKELVSELSINIAEKIIIKKLEDTSSYDGIINDAISGLKLN